jgi:hypothetical protein
LFDATIVPANKSCIRSKLIEILLVLMVKLTAALYLERKTMPRIFISR